MIQKDEFSTIDQAEFWNVANYFRTKKQYMEMRILYSTLFIIQRIYVLILLFDSNTKQNAFSWIYLLLAAYFWVRTPKSSTIKALNRWSIFILVLQYIFLLLNINPQTSLIPIPDNLWNLKNMSVVHNFLSDTKMQEYLAFNSKDNVPLLLNAAIIFFIEIYFVYFIFICSFIMTQIQKRKHFVSQFSSKIWINFVAWKNNYIVFLQNLYEGIMMNFHLIVVILCIILSCSSFELFNLITTIMCLGYFFYYEFLFNQDQKSEKINQILMFFKVLRLYTFLILVVFTVLKIPQIDQWVNESDDTSYFREFLKQEVISFHISEKIFILFFIQLVFDIMQSSDHYQFLQQYQKVSSLKSRLRRKCIAYQFNNEKLKKIETRLQENKELIRNVQEVQNQLDNWHASIDMKGSKNFGKMSTNLSEIDERKSINSISEQAKFARVSEAKRKEENMNVLDTFYTPEELQKEKEKKSTPQFKRYLRKFATMFKNARSQFLFKDELAMIDFIIKNNPYILESYLTSDFQSVEIILDFLDNLYAQIFAKIRSQGIDEFNPDKLRRNLQKAASSSQNMLDDFKYLKDNNSMKPNEIEAFRTESKIYSNFDRVMVFDQTNRIKLYNLDEERWFMDTNKNKDTLMTSLIKYTFQVLLSGWSYICYIFFLFYYFKNDGLTSLFFPLFVFLYFMVEEKIGEMLIWQISFLYVSLLIIFKFVNSLSGLIQVNTDNVTSYQMSVFFNSNNSLFFEGFLYFLIYVELALIRRMGLHKKMMNQEENTHMCYVRAKVNKFIKPAHDHNHQFGDQGLDIDVLQMEDDQLWDAEEMNRKSSYFVLLQKSLPESLLQQCIQEEDQQQESKLISQEDLKKIKQEESENKKKKEKETRQKDGKSQTYKTDMTNMSDSCLSINSVETEFTQEGFYKRLEDDIEERPQLIDPEAKSNFFSRLFSKYTKKSGVDLYPWIALIQVFLLVYIFVFYNMIDSSGADDLQSSIKFNQFSGSMIIIMIIHIAFMVWERYITLYTSEEVQDKEVERIKLIVRGRQMGLSFEKNMKNLKTMEKEIQHLERIKKEEEEYQRYASRVSKGESEEDKKESKNEESEENKKEKSNKKFRISQILMKYIQLTMIVILFIYFTFFYIPQPFFRGYDGSIDWTHYQVNGYLGGLFFFFCIYFVLSCIQIKIGYNQFKIRNTLLVKKNLISGVCAKIFRAIPFIQELKVVMDWTFTATTLDLFQWFKIEDIHFYLFCAKVDSNDHKKKPVGMKQPWIMKISMGWLLLIVILLLIFGPMILFSSLNPTSKINNITNASFTMGIQVNGAQQSYYQLYQNGNIGNLTNVPSSSMDKFSNISAIANAQSGQFQEFSLYSSSDVNWQLSVPSIAQIKQILQAFVDGDSNGSIQLSVRYNIMRSVSTLNSVSNTFLYPISTSDLDNKQTSLNVTQVQQLLGIMNDCNSSAMKLPNFYIYLLRLDTSDDQSKARPFTNLSPTQQLTYFNHAYLNLKCKYDETTKTYDQNIRYWELSLDQDGKTGLDFYVLCDKYSSVLMGLSIITIYVSVILVIGKLIKSVFSGDVHLLTFTEQPHSDKLIKICDAIAYSRAERDLIKENLLYWELIDLLRSPEVVKMLTGSYSKVILNKRKKELEEAEKNEIERLKKKEQ